LSSEPYFSRLREPENVSLHYEPKRGLVSKYQKRDLVPFGEYVPLRNFTRKFSSLVDTVKDFVPGQDLSVHEIGGFDIFSAYLF